MLSMVPVQCPHCGINGQIMLPPLGAIIVGPCPNCDELVVVFCGRVLPLVKAIIVDGTPEQREVHLRTVIFDFLIDRIKKVVDQLTPEVVEGLHDYGPEDDDYRPPDPPATPPPKAPDSMPQPRLRGSGPITDEKVRFFLGNELPKVDKNDDFRRNFGG